MTHTLHQVMGHAGPFDAITTQALFFQELLREWGLASEIFATGVDPTLSSRVRPLSDLPPGETPLLYHHSGGGPAAGLLLQSGRPLVLVYHNITPAHFFDPFDSQLAAQCRLGRAQLAELRPAVTLALADSDYNALELRQAGYQGVDVVPISLDPDEFSRAGELPPLLTRGDGPLLLFVGRLVPHKRQEDLVKLLFYFRRIRPEARLALVGQPWVPAYGRWLVELADFLGVRDGLLLTGGVSQEALVACYRAAAAYVSMSEHEGFGKPIIESMFCDLPVVAFRAGSTPETLGGAGLLFWEKDYERLAEAVDLAIHHEPLRRQIIDRQRARVQAFLPEQVAARLHLALAEKGFLP